VTLQVVASAAPSTIWSLGVLNVSSTRAALPTADAAAVSSLSVVQLTSAA
jgi:hypothetical protein